MAEFQNGDRIGRIETKIDDITDSLADFRVETAVRLTKLETKAEDAEKVGASTWIRRGVIASLTVGAITLANLAMRLLHIGA